MTARISHTVTRDDDVTRDDAIERNARDASAAKRQRAYRLRRQRAVIDAIGQESSASRVALLTLLAKALAGLEAASTPANMIEVRRASATRVLKAIVTRYDIEL